MMDSVIIGSGNVADALANALKDAGAPPLQIFARNMSDAAAIAARCGCDYTGDPAKLAKADIYIIAVSDKAIQAVSKSLNFGDSVVAHTAGSVSIDDMSSKIRNRAVIYPLQTFTKGRKVNFTEVPMMIEGKTPKSLETVRNLAGLLSDNVMEVSSSRRAIAHLAAVFASNFTNYMYTVGEELVNEAGLDFKVLKPLIAEVAAKAVSAVSPKDTQTGPAVRNDYTTKSLHCEMLSEKPDMKSIYINLSKSIWETSKKTSQK